MLTRIFKNTALILLCLCVAFPSIIVFTGKNFVTGLFPLIADPAVLFPTLILGLLLAALILLWSRGIRKEMKSNRESNLELCRIFCILMVIAHHSVLHGGIISTEGMTTNKFLALLLYPGGKFGFICFLAISCWFLVDQEFRMKRFVKIWAEIFFYSVLMAVVAYFMGAPISGWMWLRALLPTMGKISFFPAVYLVFYLFLPFLNKASRHLTRKQARILLLLLFLYETISQDIGYLTDQFLPFSSELLLFVFCYVIALNLKRWPIRITDSRAWMLGLLGLVWFVLWFTRWYLDAIDPNQAFCLFILNTMNDESSVLNLIGGFSLFFFFKSIRIPQSALINALAGNTLAVLLIHDHEFFRYQLWNTLLHTSDWYGARAFPLFIFLIVLWIFSLCAIMDQLRVRLLERPLLNGKRLQGFCQKCDLVLNEDNTSCKDF